MNETTNSEWSDELSQVVEELFVRTRLIRRHLHRHPEPSGEEFETSKYLAEQLTGFGFSPRLGPEGRGVIVDVGEPNTGLGIRSDIDALWIQDDKQTEYRSSVPGVMHACGHDGHAATVFGAIVALEEMQRLGKLPWPVGCRGIFQPAEETNRGAHEMIDAGAMDGLRALLGVHMDPSRRAGTIGVRLGDFTADCHEMEIIVLGRGAHAARPHEAVDPISAVAQLINSIYLFVPRSTDSQDPVVVTFGQIEGGHAPNAIPDKVIVRGTLRTLDTHISEATMVHIDRLMRGIAEVSGTKISIRWESGPPPVKNDLELTALLTKAGRSILGSDQVQTIHRPSMGGEDFANYLPYVKGAMFRLGCTGPVDEPHPLHSSLFDIDETALRVGAEILAHAAIEWHNPHKQSYREL